MASTGTDKASEAIDVSIACVVPLVTSARNSMIPDVQSYLESWHLELVSRANRVRNLIGDAHWLTDGHHKEELIRDFLRRYLSNGTELQRGFIRPSMIGSVCTPEIDILVTHPSMGAPYFMEGGVQIVHPNSVLAHLEVKSEFTSSYLQHALLNCARVRRIALMNSVRRVPWSGIVFYFAGKDRTPESILETFKDALKKSAAKYRAGVETEKTDDELFYPPQCVVVGDQYVVFLTHCEARTSISQSIAIRLFARETLCLSCALVDMFGSINAVLFPNAINVFESSIELIQFRARLTETVEV